jgi:glycosyltransferase involved in cell wall biosynthesis
MFVASRPGPLRNYAATPPSRPPAPGEVTVILCTRDRPDLLANALAALTIAVGKTGADVLVVDSGSRLEATADVARAAGVRYLRSDVPGLSIARNAGLSQTDREIVVYTDDDCAVDPGFLEPLLRPFADPAVGAATGALHDGSAGAPSPVARAEERLSRTTAGLDAGHGALMAFRRTALLGAGAFDPILGAGRHFGGAEDMDAFCRILSAGHLIVRVPSAVVNHLFTRDDDDYLRLNENYGLGIGAMCAKWLRQSPREGRALTALIGRRGISRYARRFGHRRTRRGQGVYLRAVLRGWREAREIPLAGPVFADIRPPEPVTVVVPSQPAAPATAAPGITSATARPARSPADGVRR